MSLKYFKKSKKKSGNLETEILRNQENKKPKNWKTKKNNKISKE